MNAHSGERAPSDTSDHAARGIRLGLVGWVVFAVVAVAARGVRWDEAFEHGQILSGQVPYPESHPLYRYVHNGFSLQTYLSAAVVAVASQPVVLCGIRNVLFILAGVVPVYLFTARLTGDAIWGHAAALLTLNGTFLEFDSSYPLSVWPNTFTNGYLGGGYMLLTLYMVLAGHLRAGLFLLGLAPAIHIGQLPAIAGVCGLFLVWHVVYGDRVGVLRAIPFGVIGVGSCIAFAGVMRLFQVPASNPPPDPETVQTIWRGYTTYYDPHRQFPPANAHIAAAITLFLGAMLARTRGREQPIWIWLFIFAGIVATTVWATMVLHAATGPDIPFLFIGWMPYRLLNLLLPVLLVMLVGALSRGPGRWMLLGALVFAVALPALESTGSDVVDRYLASGEFLFFALTGAAVVELMSELNAKRFRPWPWLVALVCGWLALAAVHQWGAICVLMGAAALLLTGSRKPAATPPRWASVLGAALLAVVLLADQALSRENLPRSEFDEQITAYLAGIREPDAMLLAHPREFLLQARTGRPVRVETATASLMSYLPELGPEIQRTYDAIYGIRFDRPPSNNEDWKTLWNQRAKQEWNTLASRFRFDYVIAPAALELDLDAVLKGETATLYRARSSLPENTES
jgi:hypothetical protein